MAEATTKYITLDNLKEYNTKIHNLIDTKKGLQITGVITEQTNALDLDSGLYQVDCSRESTGGPLYFPLASGVTPSYYSKTSVWYGNCLMLWSASLMQVTTYYYDSDWNEVETRAEATYINNYFSIVNGDAEYKSSRTKVSTYYAGVINADNGDADEGDIYTYNVGINTSSFADYYDIYYIPSTYTGLAASYLKKRINITQSVLSASLLDDWGYQCEEINLPVGTIIFGQCTELVAGTYQGIILLPNGAQYEITKASTASLCIRKISDNIDYYYPEKKDSTTTDVGFFLTATYTSLIADLTSAITLDVKNASKNFKVRIKTQHNTTTTTTDDSGTSTTNTTYTYDFYDYNVRVNADTSGDTPVINYITCERNDGQCCKIISGDTPTVEYYHYLKDTEIENTYQKKLTAGDNITIDENNVISSTGGGGSFDIDKVYPIGSIYMSAISTNPKTYFGGTWTQLQSRFLYATNQTENTGSATGKDNLSTITGTTTDSQSPGIPAHTHTFTTDGAGSHSHTIAGISSRQSGSWNGVVASANTSDRAWSTVSTEGWHTHSGTTNSTGSGSAHAHNIPYIAVYMWQRIA